MVAAIEAKGDTIMNLIAIRQPVEEPDLQPEQQPADLGLFSLRTVFSFLVRRWVMICATALLVFVICFAAFLFERPKYTATALLMINPPQERVLTPQQNLTGVAEMVPSAALVDSEIEVLHSPMLIGRLVDSLNLVNDPEWNSAIPRGEAAAMNYLRTSMEEGAQAAARRERVRERVIQKVSKAIAARRRAASFAVEVSIASESPERAAQMANRLVDLFLEYHLESRFQTAERANTWLTSRLRDLRNDVQAKEGAAAQFRARSGLLSAEGALLTEQQTTEIQGTVLAARADLAEREARYRQVQEIVDAGGSPDAIGGVIDSGVIAQLRARESDIARRQAEAEDRYTEEHPTVQNIRAERADIREQIREEVARVAASLRNEVSIARTRLNTLQGNMNEVRGQLAGNNETLVQLRELEREAAATRTVYEAFLQRFHEITDQGNLSATTAQLVSRASIPTSRSSPNLRIAIFLSLGLGIALGIAVGLIMESLDEGFRTGEEVERKVGLPALAAVPKLRPHDFKHLAPASQHPAGYLVERQMSAFTEALRVLRTSILYGRIDQKVQVVAVTSALPDEGKTTVSLCLARVAALSGQKVLLIDCDLRRRSLKDVLGLEPPLGLLQVLSGEANWRQTIYVDEASGMHLLPLKDSSFTPQDVFGSDGMVKLLNELRGAYDLIVMDCAPVLAVAETRVVVSMADASVVVARWEKTPVRAVRSALAQIQSAGANVIGVVLNYIDTRVPGYAYRMDNYYTT
ncbi:MAG: GumC family protein [Hyphomonadaceae bacterium]